MLATYVRRLMDRYKKAFLVAVSLISLPSIFFAVVGLVSLSASYILFWSGRLSYVIH
jgi:hypothetical protein